MLLLESYDFSLINNTYATRPASGTIIDHVWSNFSYKSNFVILNELSDHCGIRTFFDCQIPEKSHVKSVNKTFTDWPKFKSKLATRLSLIDRNTYSSSNVDNMLLGLTDVISQSLNETTTIKTMRARKVSSRPWINDQIVRMSHKKKDLRKLARRFPHDESICLRLYCLEKKIQHEKNQAQLQYYDARFTSGSDAKQQWNELNNILGRKKSETTITKLKVNDQITTDTKEIAQALNKHFVNIGEKMQSILRPNRTERRHLPNPIAHSIFIQGTDEMEVKTLLLQLSANKAVGCDGISNVVLKTCASEIAWFLAACINKSITSGRYPDSLKIAKVTPLFKKGKREDCENYRPISVLTGLNKIFEKIIHRRFNKFFEQKQVITTTQFGFRSKCGTANACTEVLDHIYKKLDEKNISVVSALFIDLQKAFDTISHEILLDKLFSYGIRGVAHELIKSYLSNRKQKVKLGNEESDLMNVTAGVPQGSVLGPLLFLVMVNDLPTLNLRGVTFEYADDAVLIYACKNVKDACQQIIEDLKILEAYFNWNYLSVSWAKTKVIHFHHPRTNVTSAFQIKSPNGETVETVKTFRYLGIYLDQHLSWETQCQYVTRTINPAIAALYKLRNCLPKQAKSKIYFALIHSHLCYVSQVWGTAAATHLRPLQILQNRAIKLIHSLPRLTPTSDLFNRFEQRILPVKGIHVYAVLKYVKLSINLETMCNLTFERPEVLRFRTNIRQTWTPTRRGQRKISVLGAKMYNQLPQQLKIINSSTSFLKGVKQHLHSPGSIDRLLRFHF